MVIDIGRVRERVGEGLEEGQVNKNVSVVVERWREGVRIPEAVKQTAEDQVMAESSVQIEQEVGNVDGEGKEAPPKEDEEMKEQF